MPTGGNPLWQWDIPFQLVANAAPCTTVLGLLGSDDTKSIFAVADPVGCSPSTQTWATRKRIRTAWSTTSSARAVGDSYRRVFNSLSDIGRVIFVRAAKWAMGETLTPYVPLGIIKVSSGWQSADPALLDRQFDQELQGSRHGNLLGPADFSNWQTVAQDIAGADGAYGTSVKLDISRAAQVAFLRVTPVP